MLYMRVRNRCACMEVLCHRYGQDTHQNFYPEFLYQILSYEPKLVQFLVTKKLSGVSIPNSVIRAEACTVSSNKEIEDKNVLREMRDASVKEIIKRMESRVSDLYTLPNCSRVSDLYTLPNVSDVENVNKTDGAPEKLSARESVENLSASASISLKLDPVKEQRRVSRRTEYLAPLSCHRKSTYESIKRAIQNCKSSSKLIDIDSIEAKRRRKLEVQDSLELRIASLANTSPLSKTSSQKQESSQKVTTKSSRTSKKSTTSSQNSKKLKVKRRKSILKRGSREGNKLSRTVSILEHKMEDSETQTYLNMKDFFLEVKEDT
ncbi:hypothetical protein QE152_g14052 [Popillia japonica]|uniref:Uncharacterized protein n=1 Tax=Popillia japonica TaxID=7064 RepID=A0AAW1L888_POPJA